MLRDRRNAAETVAGNPQILCKSGLFPVTFPASTGKLRKDVGTFGRSGPTKMTGG
jgi:hypothetical protein